MKNLKLVTITCCSFLVVAIIAGTITFVNSGTKTSTVSDEAALKRMESFNNGDRSQLADKRMMIEELIWLAERGGTADTRYEEMNEAQILQVIHEMTHQKIDAEEKWGAHLITQERVEQLYDVISNSGFKNKKLLIDLLTPWLDGDFSNAVKAHNSVWKLQGGTVGKATGLLTEEQEMDFLLSRFSVGLPLLPIEGLTINPNNPAEAMSYLSLMLRLPHQYKYHVSYGGDEVTKAFINNNAFRERMLLVSELAPKLVVDDYDEIVLNYYLLVASMDKFDDHYDGIKWVLTERGF